MKNAIILHDSYSSNTEPWIVSVADELKVRGFLVYTPKFPTPIGQDYISWKVLFDSYAQYISSETVVIAAGVGFAFWVRYCIEQTVEVARTVAIAPFLSPVSNPSEQLLAQTFILPAYDAVQISQKLGQLVIVVSDNDLLVDYDTSKYVADLFRSKITTLPGKGHFRAVNGVRLLPELVDIVAAPLESIPSSMPGVIRVGSTEMVNGMPSDGIASSPNPVPPVVPGENRQTTDIAALQKLLAEIHAREAAVPIQSSNVAPSSEPISTVSTSAPIITSAVEPIVPIASHQSDVTHSLVKDFSNSLINAKPAEVANTLNNYRAGKEYMKQEKGMQVVRAVVTVISLILLIGSGYFAFRVYYFKEQLPVISDVIQSPLGAKKVEPVVIKLDAVVSEAVPVFKTALSKISLQQDGEVGILALKNQNDTPVPSERAMRMLGGTSPSAIYTKVDKFYTLGVRKSDGAQNPFVMFSLHGDEADILKELLTWEKTMPDDLIPMMYPKSFDKEKFTLEFVNRTESNRDIRVLVAVPKPVEDPIITSLNSVVVPDNISEKTTAEATAETLAVSKKNGEPDDTVPVPALSDTIGVESDQPAKSAPLATSSAFDAADVAVRKLSEDLGSEEHEVTLIKLSPVEQTALKRSRDTITLSTSSPLFEKGLLPGDVLIMESSDVEDVDSASAVVNSSVAPILGGAPTILQIKDIIQEGTKTKLLTIPKTLSEATLLAGQKVVAYKLPDGFTLTKPEVFESAPTDKPIDLFAYSVVNGNTLVIVSHIPDMPHLVDEYYNQKKSVLDLFD